MRRQAVPASGPSGDWSAPYEGRLLLAGQDGGGPFQIWSIDTNTGERRLEIEKPIIGESEGLDVFGGLGGILHWQIGQLTNRGEPTYGRGHTALVHFSLANNPPDCSGVRAEPSVLWPPNHKLRPIRLVGATDPDGDPVTIAIDAVTQDEPVDGAGDGHTAPDSVSLSPADTVLLRGERRGGGKGRVYTVSFSAADGRGGSCSGAARVSVPKSRGRT